MEDTWLFVVLAFFVTALTISWGCTKPRNISGGKPRSQEKKQQTNESTAPDGPTRTTGSAPSATGNSIIQTGPSSKEMTKTTDRKTKQTISGESNLNKSTKKPSKIKDFLRKKKSTSQSQDNSKSKDSKETPSKQETGKKKESKLKKFMKRFSKESDEKDNKDSTEGALTAQSVEEKGPGPKEQSKKKTKSPHSKTGEDKGAEVPGKDKEPASSSSPKIVSPMKVKTMGNIDVLAEEQKAWRIREIEQMPSALCEDPTQLSTSVKKENLHVKIVEDRCKLYVTNADGHGGKPKNEFVTPRRKGSAPVPRSKKSGSSKKA